MRQATSGLSVAFLSAAALLPGTAYAVGFDRSYQWNSQLQAEYIAVMIDETQKGLREEGKAQFADRVQRLFVDIKPGDDISLGLAELEPNIAIGRLADYKRRAKDPKAPWLDIEDALFITLEKNGIAPSRDAMHRVAARMAKFHPQTNAEFLAKPLAEQRRIVRWCAAVGLRDYAMGDEIQNEKKNFFDLDETGMRDLAEIMQTDFPGTGEQPGFAGVRKSVVDDAREKPNEPGPLFVVIIHVIDQLQARNAAREKALDATAVVMPDGRRVYWRRDGGFSVFVGEVETKLEGADEALAQRLFDCKERRHIANGEEALAACRDEVGIAPEASEPAPAAPEPVTQPAPPPENHWPEPADDPFGGGFISPSAPTPDKQPADPR